MAWVSDVSARLSRRLRQATCPGCDSTLSPWLACDGISAYENALSRRYERVSPSFARKPCTRCPASPTRVREAMRSVAPGSEALHNTRALPLVRPRWKIGTHSYQTIGRAL